MASLIEGYEYDIFISYRQKDNKGDMWVSEFVVALKNELESTFKEEISVYFDINPHDGLLETQDVDESLKDKLKCLVFIPIISRTYCDPKSFAWEHEFKAFIEQASGDRFGLKIKLPNGNVASRVLPVLIHDLDTSDIKECESVLGGFLRGVEFIFKSPGVNRPLRSKEDNLHDNLNHTVYRDQINKAALAVRDLIESMKTPISPGEITDKETQADFEARFGKIKIPEVKKHNLQVSITNFIGREKEMKEVKDLFRKSRLVTLTGAGGCGKTRLAREIALTLVEEYKDGVWFTDLAPVEDPGIVVNTIAEVLNIREVPDKVIIDIIIDNIKKKSLLLLLDNCEHLIGACAETADRLLQSVEGICILATSREALNITGEVVWRIPPLSFPEAGKIKNEVEVQQYDAIKLFADRAGLSKPGFAINDQNVLSVVGICQRIDGMPLAIELAATRIRHLGPETILERLEDHFNILSSTSRTAPERQQTLKATIDWSYNLLSDNEQVLFNRLSVFAGDFSLEAAEEVCSDKNVEKRDIIDLLSQLVDKSLVIAENHEDGSLRYRYLVPIQQYSLQKLNDAGEEDKLRERHLSHYLKMAEQAYKEQYKSQLKWLNKLEQEYDNLISALNWSFIHSDENFIIFAGYLGWLWFLHTRISTGRDYLERALSKCAGKTEAHARVLCSLGNLLKFTKDSSQARNHFQESLGIWRTFNNNWEEANVTTYLGHMISMGGDFENGLNSVEQGLKIARKSGDPGLINFGLMSVCWAYVCSGKFNQALPFIEELSVSSEKLEQPFQILVARHYLSDCTLGLKNYKEAEKRYAYSLETALKYGNTFIATNDLDGVAYSVSGQSRWAKAIRLNAAARENHRIMGVDIKGVMKFWDEFYDIYIGRARKELGEELTGKYEEEGRNMGFEAAVNYALDFDKD
jgi:predicted ATPase